MEVSLVIIKHFSKVARFEGLSPFAEGGPFRKFRSSSACNELSTPPTKFCHPVAYLSHFHIRGKKSFMGGKIKGFFKTLLRFKCRGNQITVLFRSLARDKIRDIFLKHHGHKSAFVFFAGSIYSLKLLLVTLY